MRSREDEELHTGGTANSGEVTFPWRFTTPLYMGSVLNPINSTMIATALVPIAAALDIPVGQTSILVASLYLACAVAQPAAGRIAAEYGARSVFLPGIGLVLVGGVLGGFANTLAVMVAARFIIGLGTATGYPAAMILIRSRAADEGLTRAPGVVLGVLAIAANVTASIGPSVGGALVDVFGWRSAFLVNLPLCLATAAMAFAWIPRQERDRAAGRDARSVAARIDLVGMALFALAIGSLMIGLLALPEVRPTAYLSCAAFLVGLYAWEVRVGSPFIDMGLLRTNLPLTMTYLRGSIALTVFYTAMYSVAQWLQGARGLSSGLAGSYLLPMFAVAAVTSLPVSRRNLVQGPLLLGAVAAVIGSGFLTFVAGGRPHALALISTTLFGVLMGTVQVSNQLALYAQAGEQHLGTASGLYRTASYLGAIASAAVTAVVFRTEVTDAGMARIATTLTGISIVLLLLTWRDNRLLRVADAD